MKLMAKRQYRGKSGKTPRITPTKAAYIAGFLDGDGSISAKISPAKNGRFGYRVRIMVGFTQHTRNRSVLVNLKRIVGGGRKVADYETKNLSEWVIEGGGQTEGLLKRIKPFLFLKRKQAEIALEILDIFKSEKRRKRSLLTKDKFIETIRLADKIGKLNAMTGMKDRHKARIVLKELEERGILA